MRLEPTSGAFAAAHTVRLCLRLLLLVALPRAALVSAEEEAGKKSAEVTRRPFRVVLETEGVLVPAQGSALAVTLAAFDGKLRVAEVVPHGAEVRQGEVVLRLDEEELRRALQGARWDLRAAEIDAESLRAAREDVEARREADIEEAERRLHFAERALSGYVDIERPLTKRDYDAHERAFLHRIEDQEEEIAQLGKMYQEDELTEETEEIVLSRARRKLRTLRDSLERFRERRGYNEEFNEPKRHHELKLALRNAERKLTDLRRSHEKSVVTERIALERTRHKVERLHKLVHDLEEDGEQIVLRAPHDGRALHGRFLSPSPLDASAAADDRLGPQPLREGDTVATRSTLISIFRGGPLKAQFSVAAKDRYYLRAGAAVSVRPAALPETALAASMEALGSLPLADGTWRAQAIFGHDDPRLVPLLKCKVRSVLIDLPSALIVPSEALLHEGNRWVCYVSDASAFGVSPRTVVPGPSDKGLTVIREGLREGEQVLLGDAGE